MVNAVSNDRISAIVGFVIGLASLALSIIAFVTAIRAMREGEQSWAVWLGLIPASFVCLFWVVKIVGEIIVPH